MYCLESKQYSMHTIKMCNLTLKYVCFKKIIFNAKARVNICYKSKKKRDIKVPFIIFGSS